MVRPLKRLLSALVVSSLMLAGGAHAADVEGKLRVTGRMMLDGNAPRDFTKGHTRASTSDLVFGLLAAAEGRYTEDRWQLVGRYDGGGRKYLGFSNEDVLVQAAALEGSLALGSSLGVGVEGRAKDRRGGSRAYTDLAASAFVEYAPDTRLSLRLRAGAHRFLYHRDFSASFGGPEVGFLARYRLVRRHALTVSGEYGSRRYHSSVRYPPGTTPEWTGRREDGALMASVGYSYKGPLALGLSYSYQETSSNSFGESVQRHRLSGTAGVRLPWKLTLMAQGSLGLNRYPDGVYLSPEIILLEDDEAQNTLSLKLARPLSTRVDLEFSYAMYGTRLPRNDLFYFRQVAGVGLTWRP
ncbi:hypothetical protein JQX13_25240 [Archangium violaceum]|uniref:hypothetical protein n=1 Tax=Archangium violaceum TaxID=83451 RepID=UPI00193BFFF0|nr:hypothetical protein [Archangium violaceum]QRK13038.1 hypothetical protein JQX13_25240 [Archangium violaceum]